MENNRKRIVLRSLHRPELDSFPKVGLPFYPRSMGHFQRNMDDGEVVPPGQKRDPC